ncbi:MAG: hypothetical protein RLZZ324_994 [Candidatus Parcubacteria bacterium]
MNDRHPDAPPPRKRVRRLAESVSFIFSGLGLGALVAGWLTHAGERTFTLGAWCFGIAIASVVASLFIGPGPNAGNDGKKT